MYVAMTVVVVGMAIGPIETGAPGWETTASRDELRPEFFVAAAVGDVPFRELGLRAAGRSAIDGAWVRTFAVSGGQYVRFSAWRKTSKVSSARRSAIVKIRWQNAGGHQVRGEDDWARPEYPRDQRTTTDGWTEVADTYQVPSDATQAQVELRLRWTEGSVVWRDVQLQETRPPEPRPVRLATVHFRPQRGESNQDNCQKFASLIATAAQQCADLVCLPESLTYCGTGRTMAECAEPIPGPSTEYFAELAHQHDLYIVAGLTERDESVLYNTAALLGPDGQLVGKYRKVCLPREEIEAGLTPGHDYPVFETRFGRIGMMICWDVHFPEVVRGLSDHGAEVIAMPIWGGNPALARVRAPSRTKST